MARRKPENAERKKREEKKRKERKALLLLFTNGNKQIASNTAKVF